MATAKDISQEYENWSCLTTLVDYAGRSLCRDVLFKQESLPEDEVELFKELEPLKSRICRFPDQEEILCPSSGKTDHRKFDVTLFTSIITVKYGNKHKLLADDLRNARNKLFHKGEKSISDFHFNQLWKDTSQMLVKHGFDPILVGELKENDRVSLQKFRDILSEKFPDIPRQLEDVGRGIKEVNESIKACSKNVSSDIKGMTESMNEDLKDIKMDIKESVKEDVKEGVESMKEHLKDMKKDIKEGVEECVKEGVQSMKEGVKDIKKDIKEVVKEVVKEGLKESMKEMKNIEKPEMKEDSTRMPMGNIETDDFPNPKVPALDSDTKQQLKSKLIAAGDSKLRPSVIPRRKQSSSGAKWNTVRGNSDGKQQLKSKLNAGGESKLRPSVIPQQKQSSSGTKCNTVTGSSKSAQSFKSGDAKQQIKSRPKQRSTVILRLQQFFLGVTKGATRSEVKEDANEIPDNCPMKGLTKENRILDGFGWMNYKRYEDEISRIANNISKYKFKREDLEIYEGANTITILKYDQWEERCRKLLDTFFSRDGKNCGIILFPEVEITLHSQICQVEIWPRVLRTLNDWCKISSPKDATGLIIRNYDLLDHLYFHGITDVEIKDTMCFNVSENMLSFLNNDKRFLAFNPSLKIILLIRLVELQKDEFQFVKKEVDHCIDEVNLLCFLLRDELAYTGVIVTGLVAYSGENAHSQSACKDCDNTIFSSEIFNTAETFKRFLKSFLREKNNKDLVKCTARYVKKDKEANVFQAVASKILGYLSHLQFATLQEPVLPIIEQDTTDNIIQAELLLDRYQMEIAYSDDKRVWLEGDYGTGKTVVALKKLELLLKALKDKEVIYHVNFARKSPLEFLIKQRFEKHENVTSIKGEYSLSYIIKHQILPKERGKGTKNIHLVVDEYSSQDLSTKEVESLIPILNDEEELINSTVLIAVQPIKINRVDKFCEEGIKRQFSETKHDLNKLITATGIKVKILENVMRTTVQINKLAKITRKYLDNQSNRCVRQDQRYNIKSILEKLNYVKIDEEKLKEENFNSSFQSTNLESNFPLSVTSEDSSSLATTNPPFQLEKLIDYDEFYQLVHTESIRYAENYQETVTSFSYTCDSQIGHDVNGPLPQLIKLPKLTNLSEQVALIAAVFYEVIAERKPIRIAVIHFEPEDPPLWLKSLFQMKNISKIFTVKITAEEFFKDTSNNCVLVKNLNFLRGFEFSKVLLILNSNEHHLRHLTPEAITRCMKDLTILIRPPVHGNHLSDTVEDLAVEWEKHLDNGILRILKIEFCLETSCNSKKVQQKSYCNDEISFGTCYRFHQNSELYKDFLEEIQPKKIGNVQTENKERYKEAMAVLDAESQDKRSKARLEIDEDFIERLTRIERISFAASDDDVSELKELLDVGVPIDSSDRYGGTALAFAARMKRTDVIRFLCESGADVNKQSRGYQSTALHAAAWYNRTDAIEVLLKHGASTNIKDSLGCFVYCEYFNVLC